MGADPRRRTAAALAVLLLLSGLSLVLFTRGSYFFADDWLNFGLAQERRMGKSLLTESYFGHFAPGHRVGDWLLTWKFPASWTAAIVMGMACWAVTVGGTWWLLRELRTSPALAVVLTLLVASSPVWVRLLQWWASIAHVGPGMAASVIAAAAAIRWYASRDRWALALSVLAVAAGLLFYEKPVLVVGYVLLLRYLVLPQRVGVRDTLASVRRDWPLTAGFVAVGIAYAIVVTTGGYSNTSSSAEAGQWVEYLWRNWTEGVAPLLVGQASPEYATEIPLPWIVAAQVVVLLLVVVSVRRRRHAWRAWAAFVAAWFLGAAIIGVGRLAQFGPDVGLDPRYNAEMILVLAVTIATAFRGPPDATAKPLPWASWGDPRRRRFASFTLAIVAVVLAAVSVTNSSDRIEDSWQGTDARAWADNLQRSAEHLKADGVRFHIVDGAVDPRVVAGNTPPFERLSLVVPLITDDVHVGDGPSVAATVAPDGRIVVRR